MDIELGDLVQMKKPHPCGSSQWVVTRVGADIKIRCQGCGRLVMLDRAVFEKRLKKIIRRAAEGEGLHEE
ncbi:MAG: DUF951 domain-containing protein [Clostridia bacterium]